MDCNYCDTCKKHAQNLCDDSFCIRKFKLDKLYAYSNLSQQQCRHINLRIDADGTDRESFVRLKNIEKDIVNFVSDNNNLLIYSNRCGNGKTSWAIRMLQAYIQGIWYNSELMPKAMFIHIPSFLISLKKNISGYDEYASNIQKYVLDCDLVVFDELSVKCLTEFEHDSLLNIIDARLRNGKSNIYTSNIKPNMLIEYIGERLYSRIVNASTLIELNGMDKRGL